jgi:hypothetical protein
MAKAIAVAAREDNGDGTADECGEEAGDDAR